MKWWDDLWLNEGFASFVEFIGSGVADPTFGMVGSHTVLFVKSSCHLQLIFLHYICVSLSFEMSQMDTRATLSLWLIFEEGFHF